MAGSGGEIYLYLLHVGKVRGRHRPHLILSRVIVLWFCIYNVSGSNPGKQFACHL
jgi:hypothetical protein